MRNLVRKFVMEATFDGSDAAMRAHNTTIEEIVNELRDESVWYNGVDWFEVRQNRLALEEEERRRIHEQEKERDEDDSSSSSRSGGSHTTSPVLSTTTLQTTPSPPPVNKDDDAAAVVSPISGVPPAAPLHFSHLHSPSLRPSELLRPIPYVPIMTEHMPHYSREALSVVWKEACAPLWQCQCSICERAMMNANMAASETVPTQAQLAVQGQQQPPSTQQQPLGEIRIQEAPSQPLAEEEDDLDESEDESDSLDCESERGEVDEVSFAVAPIPAYHPTSRKRPSSDLEPDAESDSFSLTTTDPSDLSDRSRTPPKRMKREGSYDHSASLPLSPSVASTTSASVPPPSSSPLSQRQRKRSSEELEVEESPISGKRMRGEGEPRTPSVKGVEVELEPRTPSKESEPRVSRLSATPTAAAVTATAARGQPAVAGVVPAL
ncbi:hypothetical protein GSI_05036 [Ganoderma sinense ZZ0214-1]|uniref:Uncharacterized protein n=1 Tax=Ganoderma sinense ZZ0214-1 TaxID=1077348 RepID=A0A2G8SH70_9APHY|nr:hypothetical protein GSI_05036 [Ganoderma sinense ZZ0214-1]